MSYDGIDVERAGELSETPFRLYVLSDGKPRVVMSADDVSVGEALLAQHKMGRAIEGIMYRPVVGEPGEWLINPFGPPAVASGRLARATTEEDDDE